MHDTSTEWEDRFSRCMYLFATENGARSGCSADSSQSGHIAKATGCFWVGFFLTRRSVVIGGKLTMTTLAEPAYTLIFTHDSRMMAT